MKATYPVYGSYKDSSEGWIADVPEHWEIRKLKHLFQEKKHRPNLDLNCGSISFGEVVEKDDERVPLATKASYQEVRKGEFLVNPLNLNYDLKSLRIGLSDIDVVVSAGYLVLQAKDEMDKRYFKYLLHRYDVAYMKLLGSGVRQTISFNHIANSILIAPPLSEQRAIAAFLDDKCAKIDGAVKIKDDQIALLRERRQIIIQDAVTRGLNPAASMKDSGIDWIGQVPEHWKITRLGVCLQAAAGRNRPNLPLLSITRELGVITRNVDDQASNHNFIPEDLSNYRVLKAGQFGMNKMKAWQGSYGISPITGIVSPAYFVFDLIADVNPAFFSLAVRTGLYVSYFYQASDGVRIGQWDLSRERMKQIPFVIPSQAEQLMIVQFAAEQTQKINAAIAIKENQITALKEYKTSLINAAVTGKIKVV